MFRLFQNKVANPVPAARPQPHQLPQALLFEDKTELVAIAVSPAREPAPVFTIPPRPEQPLRSAQWLSTEDVIEVNGYTLSGGLVYVGNDLPAIAVKQEPSLIDATLMVHEPLPSSKCSTGLAQSYKLLSPEMRGAYLEWLAGGRVDPAMDIQYVFLFLYGLERRVCTDMLGGKVGVEELPLIQGEVHRLLALYGPKSQIFSQFSRKFLGFIDAVGSNEAMYLQEVPDVEEGTGVPFSLRLAIGQAAKDRVGISADFALAWALKDDYISKPTAVSRCLPLFKQLFVQLFNKKLPAGLLVQPTRTKLNVTYQAASPGLRGVFISKSFSEVTDLTVSSSLTDNLQEMVGSTASKLLEYSRYVTRSPDKAGTLKAWALLPPSVWPVAVKGYLDELIIESSDLPVQVLKDSLALQLNEGHPLATDDLVKLVQVLESQRMSIEPNMHSCNKAFKTVETFAIYACNKFGQEEQLPRAFFRQLLMLDALSLVGCSDGVIDATILVKVYEQLDSLPRLVSSDINRLKAYASLLTPKTTTLARFRKEIEVVPGGWLTDNLTTTPVRTVVPLGDGERLLMAEFVVDMVRLGPQLTATHIKTLEALYDALRVDRQLLYARAHQQAQVYEPKVAYTREALASKSTEFSLDVQKIAALQRDSAEIGGLLHTIFDEEQHGDLPAVDAPSITQTSPTVRLLGLDAVRDGFLRDLLKQVTWSSGELTALAQVHGVMLLGTLETINEAAFDQYDMPVTEGDSPLEINPDILAVLQT